jgi:hypothetical protein
VRAALAICLERHHLRRTLRIALVVGLVLTAINQLDVIVRGEATALTGVKIALNFCVPFVVSNLARLAGKRATDGADQDRVHGR